MGRTAASKRAAHHPADVAFRFDAERHEYLDIGTGEVLPHITGMMKAAGLIDDTWFTEESCERGQAVHRLTADYDLGALDPAECVHAYKAYLAGYVGARQVLRPELLTVEEARVHPLRRFGGRPDRTVRIFKGLGVLEIKSGVKAREHRVQTALQAILVAPEWGIPPASIFRVAVYPDARGRFAIEEHRDRHDFLDAERVLRQHGR